jgi:HEAT repeat protein
MLGDLVESLKHRDPTARNRAALRLGKLGSAAAAAVPVLIEMLGDEDWRVRGNAAKALAKITPTNAITMDRLLATLTDSDDCVRIETYEAIIYMLESGYNVSSSDILKVVPLVLDGLPDVRSFSVRILCRLGTSAVPAIESLAIALRDPSEDVRYWALTAFDSLGPAAVPAIPAIVKMLLEDTNEIKYAAAFVLGRIGRGSCAAASALNSLLLTTGDPHLRLSAALALAGIDDGPIPIEAANVLKENLRVGNADERRLAARALEWERRTDRRNGDGLETRKED